MFKRRLTKARYFIEYLKKGGAVYVRMLAPMSFNDMPLRGKTVLITGGSSGLGESIAGGLAEIGAGIIITGSDGRKLKALEKKCGYKCLEWDIQNILTVTEKIKCCYGMSGCIDILINCAEIGGIGQNQKVTEANLKGTYFITKEYIRLVSSEPVSESAKRIINILPCSNLDPGMEECVMSEWQALCFTKGLAKEMASRNIIVNAVVSGKNSITNIVRFLATDFSNGIAGQCIALDGGERPYGLFTG